MKNTNEEYWDLFDENRVYVGKTHLRGEKIPDGLFHLVVHSWIMDEKGNYLVSQRQKGRTDELKWERTGGSVLTGETSYEGALREVREELGLDLTNNTYAFIKSVKREKYHDFFDSWLFIVNRANISITINEEEVRKYKWVSYSQLIKMREKQQLVKTSLYIEEVYQTYEQIINANTNNV